MKVLIYFKKNHYIQTFEWWCSIYDLLFRYTHSNLSYYFRPDSMREYKPTVLLKGKNMN